MPEIVLRQAAELARLGALPRNSQGQETNWEINGMNEVKLPDDICRRDRSEALSISAKQRPKIRKPCCARKDKTPPPRTSAWPISKWLGKPTARCAAWRLSISRRAAFRFAPCSFRQDAI